MTDYQTAAVLREFDLYGALDPNSEEGVALSKLAAALAEARENVKRLHDALQHASDHLEYCGYGDNWERECAMDSKLPEEIRAALDHAMTPEVDRG